jgi:predicted DNA-binding transcriptional regulator AlpA
MGTNTGKTGEIGSADAHSSSVVRACFFMARRRSKRRRTTMPKKKTQPRLISKAEVCDRVGRTFVTIWQWMRDGKFPMARDCGGKPAWLESEIDKWIETRPVREYKRAGEHVLKF